MYDFVALALRHPTWEVAIGVNLPGRSIHVVLMDELSKTPRPCLARHIDQKMIAIPNGLSSIMDEMEARFTQEVKDA